MTLVSRDTNDWRTKCDECFQDAAFILSQNSEVTIKDLWALVAAFQIALKQIIENQQRATTPRPTMDDMLGKK